MPIKYVGRTTTFKGKPLWEIVANLKNHGVGRMVIRSRFQRYPEPCFMRILKVAALPDTTKHPHEGRKVMALVEKTFRGKKSTKPIQIDSATPKADYVLIPKDEEYRFLNDLQPELKIMPATVEFPPLLKEMLRLEARKQNKTDIPKLPLKYNFTGEKNYRLAKEGETPTVDVTMGLGKPATPHLYADIKYDDSS
ncbi:28S ribosomal protein S34, mitochondrial [Osmia bicornis bicornis]|uniref:28S ribosomal protein S34, mitochondrial n=1 Tax=Osmia bicornis bicornis TaxID=1437191 RepID=UPI0010F51431|nr:28S ribosomal protein S34, mitochondrial [Osmia bicornis bicornis]